VIQSRQFFKGLFATSLAGVAAIGSALMQDPKPESVASKPNVRNLVSANVEFSFKLLKLLASDAPQGNVFISPFSISDALCMAMNGARGKTRTDIANTLGLGNLSQEDTNAANRLLLASLEKQGDRTTVLIGNSMWFDQRVRIVPHFASVCETDYNAKATQLDFSNASASATVNAWVNEATRGRIPQIVAPKDLKGQAAVLTNAVYFKGAWAHAFKKADTLNAPFDLSKGRTKTVPLMSMTTGLAYADHDDFQAVELPYGIGRLALTVILPHNSTPLSKVLRELDASSWEGVVAHFGSTQDVELHLPRFKVQYKVSLNDALKSAGMASAFGRSADFKDMSPDAARISNVLQVANLDVDEEGTVAAAATAVTVRSMAVRRPIRQPIVVRVDHPFLAFIRDRVTGVILFASVINNPE
jgi:serpin B